MAAQSERAVLDADAVRIHPIEFLTENGFSIIRPWETDGTSPPDTARCEFLVRHPDGVERKVLVEIADELVTRIAIHTRGRVLLSNAFWICCAERHLADYVWEHDEFPPDGSLLIVRLTPRDLNLSIRWERT